MYHSCVDSVVLSVITVYGLYSNVWHRMLHDVHS